MSLFSFLFLSLKKTYVRAAMTGNSHDSSDPSSSRPDFSRARVVNFEEVLKKRRPGTRAKAKAESKRPAFIRPRSRHPFFWRVPRVWLRILRNADAMAGLPLLLAIANQMVIKKKIAVAVTAKVWEAAEADTKHNKRVLLRALKRVPDLVRLKYRKRMQSQYLASQGPLWNAEYPYPDDDGEAGDNEMQQV
jgi:hypothetical protein